MNPVQTCGLHSSFLTSMHSRNCICLFYENVGWVEHALRAAPSLRKVTVDIGHRRARWQNPHRCLREISVACSAALTILLRSHSDLNILHAGVKDTMSLTDLNSSVCPLFWSSCNATLAWAVSPLHSMVFQKQQLCCRSFGACDATGLSRFSAFACAITTMRTL